MSWILSRVITIGDTDSAGNTIRAGQTYDLERLNPAGSLLVILKCGDRETLTLNLYGQSVTGLTVELVNPSSYTMSEDGSSMSNTGGQNVLRRWTVSMAYVAADLMAYLEVFYTKIKGSGYKFYFTDDTSNTYLVRWDGGLPMPRMVNGAYKDISFTLQEVSS